MIKAETQLALFVGLSALGHGSAEHDLRPAVLERAGQAQYSRRQRHKGVQSQTAGANAGARRVKTAGGNNGRTTRCAHFWRRYARRRSRCPPRPRRTPRPDYPNRPIRIIVCVPAGGGVDTVTRIVANGLQQRLGQPVVVENRAGAAGNIGADVVFHSDPDGYTLLAAQPSPLTINPLLYKKMNFDPTRFEPVAIMTMIRQCAAGAAGFSGQDRAGIHRLRQGQSGQGQLRLAGHRHHVASDRGAVRDGDRHQTGARALQRHRAGAQRSYRRPCRHDLHGARLRHQTARGRQARASWRWRPQSALRTCRTFRRSTRPA